MTKSAGNSELVTPDAVTVPPLRCGIDLQTLFDREDEMADVRRPGADGREQDIPGRLEHEAREAAHRMMTEFDAPLRVLGQHANPLVWAAVPIERDREAHEAVLDTHDGALEQVGALVVCGVDQELL